MEATGQHISYEISAGVATITFTRPDAMNALNETMGRGLLQMLASAAHDEKVRVVVITGSDGSFSAGVDLVGDNPVEHMSEQTMVGATAIISAITSLPKPVVAAVNGVAAGVGAAIVFATDLQVMSRSASVMLAFSHVGLMTDGASSLSVAASVGRATAMRMALLGELMTAEQAYACGLVSHEVADEDFAEAVAKLAKKLSFGPPLAYARTKASINATTLPHLAEVLDREAAGQVELFATEDAAEGMRAFVQRRRPNFSGH